jgi:hypothetical protein
MVWQNLSLNPSGEKGGNFLVQMILPVFATLRGGGRESAPCGLTRMKRENRPERFVIFFLLKLKFPTHSREFCIQFSTVLRGERHFPINSPRMFWTAPTRNASLYVWVSLVYVLCGSQHFPINSPRMSWTAPTRNASP